MRKMCENSSGHIAHLLLCHATEAGPLLEMANAVKNAVVVVIAAYRKYHESQSCELEKHKSNTRRRHTKIHTGHVNTTGSDVEQRCCIERTQVTPDPDYI